MNPSRRDFLGMGTLAVAATAVPSLAQTSKDISFATDTALYHTSAEALQPHVGSEFAIDRVGLPQARVVLEAVKEFPKVGQGAGECFALHFRQTEGPSLPQGTFTMTHSHFGRTMLFITPSDERGNTYSAVINHRKA